MSSDPSKNTPSVSVLMAVYHKDSPQHFAASLDSLRPFSDQLDSIVIVADGPLTEQLESVIVERVPSLCIDLVRLSASKGLGEALNTGLSHSKSDFLLRMDSDDLCRPERLDVLLRCLSEDPYLDVIGSYIAEFDENPSHSLAIRQVPLTHEKIAKLMRVRCAMNHVTCLLRRDAVLNVGGYQGGRDFAEDWWLWARLLRNDARFANINEILVDVRVGNGFIERRRGFGMLKQDLRLMRMMLGIGFIQWHHIIIVLPIKLLQRFLPSRLLSLVYVMLRR